MQSTLVWQEAVRQHSRIQCTALLPCVTSAIGAREAVQFSLGKVTENTRKVLKNRSSVVGGGALAYLPHPAELGPTLLTRGLIHGSDGYHNHHPR